MTGRSNPKLPQKKIKKPSNSNSTSKRRVAGRRVATPKRVVAFTRPKALQRRLPASYPSFKTSAWANSVMNPFTDSGEKIPDLVSGPPSVLFSTTDLNNTSSSLSWPTSSTNQEQTFVMSEGNLTIENVNAINTTGQQLMVQFLPCAMSPASFHLSRDEMEVAFAGALGSATSAIKLVTFLASMMENAADQVTPVLGWWMVLDSEGYIRGVDLLKADKLLTAKDSIKMLRLTKAGVKVTLQQPKYATGGYVYMNKGAGAFFPIYSVNDADGDGETTTKILERITTFRIGQRCWLGGIDETTNTLATKANVVKLCSQTAGTHCEALDSGSKAHTIASYPLDSVKALEYMPFAKPEGWNSPPADSFDGTNRGSGSAGYVGTVASLSSYVNAYGNGNGAYPDDKASATMAPVEIGLDALTGGDTGILNNNHMSDNAIGYNADRMQVRWCPGWMVFHPTFTTSVNPEKIIANLEIETYTAWEFIPYPRTFAHLARTPSLMGPPDARMVMPTKDSLHKKGLNNKSGQHGKGGGKR
jgi:hypothetical protein